MIEYFSIEACISMLFALVGCSIRYGELHKQGIAKITWFLIDAFIAVALGYITYLELAIQLKVELVHTILVCMLVGNIGSKTLTIIKAIVFSKVHKYFDVDTKELSQYLYVKGDSNNDSNHNSDVNETDKE